MEQTTTYSLLLATENADLAGKIEKFGFHVETTVDGFDAVRRAAKSRPDIIVLDMAINGFPGPTIALWFKLNPLTASIPIIGLGQLSDDCWKDANLDSIIPHSQAELVIGDLARDLINAKSLAANPAAQEGELRSSDPLSVALDIIDVYRKRLRLANRMIEIAAIQHDISDFEYTVRKILDAAACALKSQLLALTVLHDKTQYVLVSDRGISAGHLKALENENQQMLRDHLDKIVPIDQQIVFGRRKLMQNDSDTSACRYFGYPVKSNKETIAYLAGSYSSQSSPSGWHMSFLPDLASQIGLLLNNAELLRDHEEHVTELASILRAALETSSISPLTGTQSENSLLQYLLIVLELCHTDRGCLILFDENTGAVSRTAALGCNPSDFLSRPFKDNLTVEEYIPSLAPEEVTIDTDPDSLSRGGRMIIPLSVGDKIMGGLIVLGIPESINFRIIQAVKTLAGMGGYFVYNTSLYNQAVKSSIIEDQLNLAREIQRDMLPSAHPDFPGYDIFGRSQPARQVGGDFFDYLSMENGRLQIAIADVSGKGIPASLLMTMTRALVIAASEKTDGPEEVLRDVNSHLVNRISYGQFVTASLLSISPSEINFACAGHSPLLVFRAATGEFDEINTVGVAMGIVDSLDFQRVSMTLNPGDIALMYTDGLNEAMDINKEQFGYDRIRDVVRFHANASAEAIVEALFQAIEDHAAGSDQYDDTTVVAIKKLASKENKDASNEDTSQKITEIMRNKNVSGRASAESFQAGSIESPGGSYRARQKNSGNINALRAVYIRPGRVLHKSRSAGTLGCRRNRLWDRRPDFD